MAGIDDLLNKMNQGKKSKGKKSGFKPKSPQVRRMEREWMAGLMRPDAVLVYEAADVEPFIDSIDRRLSELRDLKTESTRDVERRLRGWKKGWIRIKHDLSREFVADEGTGKVPAHALAAKAAKREKDKQIRSKMKGRGK